VSERGAGSGRAVAVRATQVRATPAPGRARRRAPAILLAATAVPLALALVSVLALAAPAAVAATRAHPHHAAHAPSGSPLGSVAAAATGEGEQTMGIQSAAGDQLAENGLASPLCGGRITGGLSSTAQSDCRTSGFVGAAAPSNDYGLDVHINTGAVGLSKGGLLSVVQDLLIAPVWGALEWLVHALVVVLEWCYALELLSGSGTSTVASALLRARTGFTDPWLALVLAIASVLALYHGLVRRRVADTLGGALAMLAMMIGGLWVIADPGGTVGAVGRFAEQASLGTLAATAGSSHGGAATLASGMQALYGGAIGTPWCYLEFGNVRWCDEPSQLDSGLRNAALAIVAHHEVGCTTKLEPSCAPASPAAARRSELLVRTASTNGALFLAFPTNGPQRNSINQTGSLLRAICRGEDAAKCTGPAAAEAEFRTEGGTVPRLLGLLVIAIGVLGMALLFGLIALRLLAAAFLGLFLLLLAPFAVLAPAFGDGGRAVFTGWLTRLLGAFTSKLVFSFVFGALLTMQRLLLALDMFGWWMRWLLVSAFWWMVFIKRHQAVAVLQGASRAGGQGRGRREAGLSGAAIPGGGAGSGRRSLMQRAERALQVSGAIAHPGRWVQAQASARIAQKLPREEKQPKNRRKQKKNDGGSPAGKQPAPTKPTPDDQDKAGGGADHPKQPERPPRKRSGPDTAGQTLARNPRRGPDEPSTSGAPDTRRDAGQDGGRRQPERGEAGQSGGGRRPERGDTSQPHATDRVRDTGSRDTAAISPADRRKGSQRTEAADHRAGSGDGWPSWPHPALLSPVRPSGDVRSPVMEDMLAVSQRRKRQLGFESSSDPERPPVSERRPVSECRPDLERQPRQRTE
jgi:hypothetical protein